MKMGFAKDEINSSKGPYLLGLPNSKEENEKIDHNKVEAINKTKIESH